MSIFCGHLASESLLHYTIFQLGHSKYYSTLNNVGVRKLIIDLSWKLYRNISIWTPNNHLTDE